MDERSEVQAGVGDAAGDDDIGALCERRDDGLRAEVGIGGDDRRTVQCERRAGPIRTGEGSALYRPLRQLPHQTAAHVDCTLRSVCALW